MYEKVVKALNGRRFQCDFVQTPEEAKARALEIIGGRSCGIGGSSTVDELSLYDALRAAGNEVHWHWKVEKPEKNAERGLANSAEVYLCSANAILEDGRIINIDGTGNRVAATIYGPSTVIMIAGVNKVCPDFDSAMERIKRDCCPGNARRQSFKTPCAFTGECTDCCCPDRMCNVTAIMEYPTRRVKAFHVILVNAAMGK